MIILVLIQWKISKSITSLHNQFIGGGNGSRRGGPRPPSIDEVIEKIQKLISKLIPGGKSGGSKPIIFGLILLAAVWAFSGLYRVLPDSSFLSTIV